MSTEVLILKTTDKCLENAEEKQGRLIAWMKAAPQDLVAKLSTSIKAESYRYCPLLLERRRSWVVVLK